MITLQYFTAKDTAQIAGYYIEIVSNQRTYSIYEHYQNSVIEIINGSINVYDKNKKSVFSKEKINGFCLIENNTIVCTIK